MKIIKIEWLKWFPKERQDVWKEDIRVNWYIKIWTELFDYPNERPPRYYWDYNNQDDTILFTINPKKRNVIFRLIYFVIRKFRQFFYYQKDSPEVWILITECLLAIIIILTISIS